MAGFREYEEYDGLGIAQMVAKREVSAKEVLEASLERAARINPKLNAIVVSVPPQAPAGTGLFHGVPFLLKDVGAFLAGTATSFGSKLFADAIVNHDSEVVARYKRAGLSIIGKTNASEMGLIATTEPVLFGPTRNPWDLTRSPGGSSGGAAAAVAAGIVPCAHSTDGGGSTRIPASCCGLFGLKPTRARIPLAPDAGERNGGFFTHHAITRTVRDSAALLDATCGPAIGDPYWAPPANRSFLAGLTAPTEKLRIALQTKAGNGSTVAQECSGAAFTAARLCEDLGHTVVEAAAPYDLDALVNAARTIWSSNLVSAVDARCAATQRSASGDVLEPFTFHFYRIGQSVTGAEYVRAVHVVQAESRKLATFLETHDVLLTPTLADAPVPLGNLNTSSIASIEEAKALFIRQFNYSPFTVIANASGNPAMSVPLTWSPSGLPIGVQFLGRFGEEAMLFRLAAKLEEARPWFARRPPN